VKRTLAPETVLPFVRITFTVAVQVVSAFLQETPVVNTANVTRTSAERKMEVMVEF
ncbi:MAG: hypothetical protein RLZZ543_1635, partial [Bacteroidota bacterium]